MIRRTLIGFLVMVVAVVASGLAYRAVQQQRSYDSARITGTTGIESLESVAIGGIRQWIYLRGHDTNNPVLLYLHGGPGAPELALARKFGLELEKHFTVVHWDQRASGKTRREGYADDSLSIERFVEDTHELIELLCTRFDTERIYLLGHSWGSVLGVLTARDHPERLHAYIGLGQVVNMVDNEEVSLRFVLDRARAENNQAAIAELSVLTPPYAENPAELIVQRKWLNHYGGSMHRGSLPEVVLDMSLSPEYSILDFAAALHGALTLATDMWPQLAPVDLPVQAPRLEVPVYFFIGRHDYNTPFALVEEYYDLLEAPSKSLIWFENSAHMPNLEEPDRFQDVLINTVLADTRP